MSDWIPVTERLPEDDVIVLAYAPSANEPIWPAYLSDEGEVQSHWRWPDGEVIDYTVTHWQLFPEPPEVHRD